MKTRLTKEVDIDMLCQPKEVEPPWADITYHPGGAQLAAMMDTLFDCYATLNQANNTGNDIYNAGQQADTQSLGHVIMQDSVTCSSNLWRQKC